MATKTRKAIQSRTAPVSEDAMVTSIAKRISAHRKAQTLTFDALAQRSGVSKGTVVQIEQEIANPSIATLCRLAAALGVSVVDLVSPVQTDTIGFKLVSAKDSHTLWNGPLGGSAILLAGTTGPHMLEMWQWELKPGERFEAESHGRGTREIIHVTAGRLSIEIDGKSALVAAGHSAIALTDRPHAYANPGKAKVRFYMTVEEPGFAR